VGVVFLAVRVPVAVFLFPVPMVAGVHVRARRNAVLAAVGAGGHAQVAGIAQPGQSEAAGAGLHRAVAQAARRGLVAFLLRVVVVRGVGLAGDVVVAGITQQAVHVQHEVVAAGAVEPEHAAALVVDRVAAQLGAAGQRCAGQLAGDAAVDHVDRAADGPAAEQQGRRALEHLDLVGQERLHAGGMVGADGGRVLAAQPACQHLHARAVHAAQDRTAHARAEIAGLHAGQPGHGLAQGRGARVIEGLALQHFHRACQGLRIAGQRRGGDLQRRQFGGVVVGQRQGWQARAGQRDGGCQRRTDEDAGSGGTHRIGHA